MEIDRRTFTAGSIAAATLPARTADAVPAGNQQTYGLITQLLTTPAQRGELVQCLAAGTKNMPGCLSYVIAVDEGRDDAVWVTEIWTDSESHAASLKLPAVQQAMMKGRPLITGVGTKAATHPAAGV
jgi:quinol monooxygenase YgiN